MFNGGLLQRQYRSWCLPVGNNAKNQDTENHNGKGSYLVAEVEFCLFDGVVIRDGFF